MTHSVTVQYFKYPDTPHWRHELIWLGEDAHGIWLGGRPGMLAQRGSEPPVPIRDPMCQLITPDRWWTALFNGGHHKIHTYVDVTTVATWANPHRVELVDIDLDVVRRRDGSIYVDDEDEFELHRVSRQYPPRMVASARAAAARLAVDLEAGAPPFDGTADAWLALLD